MQSQLDPCNLLAHHSSNPDAPETILLIHGAFSSSAEWDLVSPTLSKHYHLLIPDLPGHGKSVVIQPFDITTSSKLLADLIRSRAHNAKCHVVGFSLGSIVAVRLASQFPDVVDTLLVSGYLRLPPSATAKMLPYFFALQHTVTSLLPRPLLRYAMDSADIQSSPWSSKLNREICTAVVTDEVIEPISARTLVIAATKGGFIPSNDRIPDARGLGDVAKAANSQSRVVEHRGMRHPWNRQDPELFAKTVMAWIEGSELPAGFLNL
jgi:pimeloyl-ACP methyl ester carboxylesterase